MYSYISGNGQEAKAHGKPCAQKDRANAGRMYCSPHWVCRTAPVVTAGTCRRCHALIARLQGGCSSGLAVLFASCHPLRPQGDNREASSSVLLKPQCSTAELLLILKCPRSQWTVHNVLTDRVRIAVHGRPLLCSSRSRSCSRRSARGSSCRMRRAGSLRSCYGCCC